MTGKHNIDHQEPWLKETFPLYGDKRQSLSNRLEVSIPYDIKCFNELKTVQNKNTMQKITMKKYYLRIREHLQFTKHKF